MADTWHKCSRCGVLFTSAAQADNAVCPPCTGSSTVAEPGWFYAVDRRKLGPVPRQELVRLASAGRLKPTDMVLREGSNTWTKAQAVEGLFASTALGTVSFQPSHGDTKPVGDNGPAVRGGDVGRTRIPGFEILELLGRGGMGVVYKARQTQLGRLVALKMILAGAQAGPQELARFRTEAQAVAQLRHPNVVQIYEVGEHEDKPYFALEFIEGGTLAKYLGGAPLTPRQAAELVEPLARAMEAAHQAGIVHRDLKPANILLAPSSPAQRSGQEGVTSGLRSISRRDSVGSAPRTADQNSSPVLIPKVADFGLAKRLDDDSAHTQTGAVMGTPSYMAPEQAAGQTAGPSADLYALGAILYECLTGRPPFRGATMVETLDQVRTREPVPPRSLQPGVPIDLETICLKCLEKDPARRYPAAGALADDLQRFLQDRPILARPANLWERSVKFTRRNKLLVGSAAAIFLTLLGGLITSSVFLGQAQASARTAEENLDLFKKEHLARIVQSAKLARQRGQLTEAIKLFDQAMNEGHPRTVELLFEKAKAQAALNRTDEAIPLVDQLRKRPDQGKHAGEILLLRADISLGKDTEQAIQWIDEAIKLGLPAADKEYALALIAGSVPEAIDHCRKALVHDPHHHSALGVLSLSLLITGWVDEARDVALRAATIYPRDPNFRILQAIVYSLRGQPAAARNEILEAQEQLGAKTVESLTVALEVLGDLTNWEGMMDDEGSAKMTLAFIKLAPHLKNFFKEDAKVNFDNLGDLIVRQAKAPPLVARNMLQMMKSVTALVNKNVSDETLADMEKVLKIHPEGTLRYIHGMMYFSLGKYRQAEQVLLRAANEPAVSAIRKQALLAALRSQEIMLSPEWSLMPEPEVQERAIANLRVLYTPGKIGAVQAEMMANVAQRTRQLDLARAIVADWEKVAPKDPALHRRRVNLLLISGDFTGAVRAAALAPNDAEVRKMRDRALGEIARFLKEQTLEKQ